MSERSIYKGPNMECTLRQDGIATLFLDHGTASVNKFDKDTLADLSKAVDAIKSTSDIKGLVIASRKDVFVVGADITEFKGYFASDPSVMTNWLRDTHKLFSDVEDLPYPTVTAINGVCLGGGMELALTTCYRVASTKAQVGLPETKLGIYPGWGGTIRLPRLIGADNAIEWIAGGGTNKPDAVLKVGALDAVVADDKLLESAYDLLGDSIKGKLNWESRRSEKINPLKIITPTEGVMVFESAKAFVGAKAGPHYPAPLEAIKAIQKHASKGREEASEIEIQGFVKLAQTPVADNLVTIFLSDQFNKKKTKGHAKAGNRVKTVGVLGAGIMGGGIAYQTASRGIPTVMKDINSAALELGLNEAGKLLNKQLERGKINSLQLSQVMGSITPALSYGEFGHLDLVIEAVVENENVKKSVYKDLENQISNDAIIASNTSTISITGLAKDLKRPENFCGIHFFNPVHRMPLVEIIKGEKSSDHAVNTAVSYALSIGKTPIVVNDCPGFLVNRVLFPYFFGFQQLLADGVDYRQIDKTMEKFGWPMGPAYLLDVVGIDTAVHAAGVMAKGFPDRMSNEGESAMTLMNSEKRLGQKNDKGFYSYIKDRKGRPKKTVDPQVEGLLQKIVKTKKEASDEEIIDRMMIPMINESIRCLEDNIVATPMEVDLGVLYGLGFPPFRGGVLKYAQDCGLEQVLEKTKKYENLGAAYKAPNMLEQLVAGKKDLYPKV
ncbi:MAG: fatty acid oxidation complex subunit alpha FadB [Oligoflexales bacterium]|nr:fatty acid oxidation complex subunit alpha FadB [Oligoflexales bacterium]